MAVCVYRDGLKYKGQLFKKRIKTLPDELKTLMGKSGLFR